MRSLCEGGHASSKGTKAHYDEHYELSFMVIMLTSWVAVQRQSICTLKGALFAPLLLYAVHVQHPIQTTPVEKYSFHSHVDIGSNSSLISSDKLSFIAFVGSWWQSTSKRIIKISHQNWQERANLHQCSSATTFLRYALPRSLKQYWGSRKLHETFCETNVVPGNYFSSVLHSVCMHLKCT